MTIPVIIVAVTLYSNDSNRMFTIKEINSSIVIRMKRHPIKLWCLKKTWLFYYSKKEKNLDFHQGFYFKLVCNVW